MLPTRNPPRILPTLFGAALTLRRWIGGPETTQAHQGSHALPQKISFVFPKAAHGSQGRMQVGHGCGCAGSISPARCRRPPVHRGGGHSGLYCTEHPWFVSPYVLRTAALVGCCPHGSPDCLSQHGLTSPSTWLIKSAHLTSIPCPPRSRDRTQRSQSHGSFRMGHVPSDRRMQRCSDASPPEPKPPCPHSRPSHLWVPTVGRHEKGEWKLHCLACSCFGTSNIHSKAGCCIRDCRLQQHCRNR